MLYVVWRFKIALNNATEIPWLKFKPLRASVVKYYNYISM
jgi:hypothetical protein